MCLSCAPASILCELSLCNRNSLACKTTYVCTYAIVRICVCVSIHTYIHVFTFVLLEFCLLCTYVCVHMRTYVRACTCEYVHMYVHMVWCGVVTWALCTSQHTPLPAVTSLHSHVLTHIPLLLKLHLSSHSPLTTSLHSPPSLLILHTLSHSPNSHSLPTLPFTPPTSTNPTHSHSSHTLYSSLLQGGGGPTIPHHQSQEAPLGLVQGDDEDEEKEGEVPDVDELYQWTQGLSFEDFDNYSRATNDKLLDFDSPQLSHYLCLPIVCGWVGESVCAIGLLVCYCLFPSCTW